MLDLVRELQRELGLTILFISHNLAVVRYVANYVAVMYLGQIVEYGTTAEVLADPQRPYTRDLLAAIPGSGAAMGDTTVALAEVTDPHHLPQGCRYHPRCPIGPLVYPDREVCRTVEPTSDHRQAATCHFAEPRPPADQPPRPADQPPRPAEPENRRTP